MMNECEFMEKMNALRDKHNKNAEECEAFQKEIKTLEIRVEGLRKAISERTVEMSYTNKSMQKLVTKWSGISDG